MSRPGILLDRNHDVGAGRSLSSNQSQWHRSHTVVCSMSSSLNIHIQCNEAYSLTLIQWYICHTVVCSMSHSWGLFSHTFPSLSEAGSRKSQFWAKEASTDTFPMSFSHFSCNYQISLITIVGTPSPNYPLTLLSLYKILINHLCSSHISLCVLVEIVISTTFVFNTFLKTQLMTLLDFTHFYYQQCWVQMNKQISSAHFFL